MSRKAFLDEENYEGVQNERNDHAFSNGTKMYKENKRRRGL